MSNPTRKSVTMLSNTGRQHNVKGEPIRGDGYFLRTDGLHTVQVIYSNFTGQFGLQATLEVSPKEEDWFFVNLNNFSSVQNPYISLPANPLNPTGDTGDTGTQAFSFLGNFVYLRAVVNREYIPAPDPTAANYGYGHIDKVLLCM